MSKVDRDTALKEMAFAMVRQLSRERERFNAFGWAWKNCVQKAARDKYRGDPSSRNVPDSQRIWEAIDDLIDSIEPGIR